MPISADDLEIWAQTYIVAQQDPTRLADGKPHWWAIEKFWDSDAEDCWAAILYILSRDPPPEVKGVLSAGPLEDLVEYHGAKFIDRIETRARQDAQFRDLLDGIWESGPPDVWRRVEKACGR